MRKTGTVVSVRGDMIEVRFERPEACAKCGACGGGGKSRSIRLKADCAVGDWVKVELPDGRFLGATALAYALPLACFSAGPVPGLQPVGRDGAVGASGQRHRA